MDSAEMLLKDALAQECLGEALLLRLAETHAQFPDRRWSLMVLAQVESAMALAVGNHLGVAPERVSETIVEETISRARLDDWAILIGVIPRATDHAIRDYLPLLDGPPAVRDLGALLIAHEQALAKFASIESEAPGECSVADALALLPRRLRTAWQTLRPGAQSAPETIG